MARLNYRLSLAMLLPGQALSYGFKAWPGSVLLPHSVITACCYCRTALLSHVLLFISAPREYRGTSSWLT